MRRKRVGKYRRVSTKEQGLRGFSLDAQDEALDKYIADNDLICVGDYVDEGFSASSSRRPGLKQLLEDVQLGAIDIILFTKLDRWFRSVSQYYKIQDILEENNTAWRAILEDYNTETSDGKFKVNIMLSVAQNEIDKTSERIKVVFDHKIAKKQAVTGAQPLGYKIEDGKVVKDLDTAPIVEDIFDTFEREQSFKETLRQIQARHNIDLRYTHLQKIINNRKYTGEYRDIPDYYPQYVSAARFDYIQSLKKKNIKGSPNNITYIFSKLLFCGECGHTLTGNPTYSPQGKQYLYYKCAHAYIHELCSKKRRISEKKFEQALLNVIEERVKDYMIQAETAEDEAVPEIDPEEIRAEMERLNFMFRKRRISEEMYDFEYEQLAAKLETIPKPQGPNKKVERLLESDFRDFYEGLPPEDKRLIWRSVIDKIVVRGNTDFDIIFH